MTSSKLQPIEGSVLTSAYLVPGLPHVLLAHDQSPAWRSLYDSYAQVREEIAQSDADLILYFSTQWLSVLGYLFQADPAPEWTLVDHNWHEFGSIHYKFKIDTAFSAAYASEVKEMGHYVREVNYRGFPIDTGTIVAQKLLNPDNRLPAAMASCNMYAEKQETLSIGQAATRALKKSGKRAIAVVVSGLSNRFEVKEIDPKKDKVSSLKDDEWNRKVLEIFAEGRLEDVSEVAREFARQANADMGFKGIWWLNGLCGKSNDFTGKVFDYQPIWGTGAALAGLYPKSAIVPQADWNNNELDLTERAAPVSAAMSAPAPANVAASVKDHKVHAAKAPEPVGPYPHARREGEFIFLSGVGPRKQGTKEIPGVTLDASGKLVDHDITLQTRSVIENVKTVLEAAGSRMEDVVDIQVFLTDMKRDFATFNQIYGEYFAQIGPTRTTIEVGSLPTPIAVELKVIAKVRL
jgi:2-aminophenol/2-amino-5-chlorophenol 1,6-dioxygenase alpha subunit